MRLTAALLASISIRLCLQLSCRRYLFADVSLAYFLEYAEPSKSYRYLFHYLKKVFFFVFFTTHLVINVSGFVGEQIYIFIYVNFLAICIQFSLEWGAEVKVNLIFFTSS